MRSRAKADSTKRTTRRKPLGELALIQLIRAAADRHRPSTGNLVLGIGDDCAILRPGDREDVVITTDFTLEGRHFRRDWHGAHSAGHRTLARGLSDLAAMGARPMAAFLSLALPRDLALDRQWVKTYLRGLFSLARDAGIPLAGGDTAEAPGTCLLADIVCLGAVPRAKALRRDGAQAGDRLYVTGALGGAAAELRRLAAESAPQKPVRKTAQHLHPQLFPQPRLQAGQDLARGRLASAAIDVSDGLSTDLLHLCEASRLSAELYADEIPLHALLKSLPSRDALALALHGGEDYELLFTSSAGRRVPSELGGVPVTEIGCMTPMRSRQPRLTLTEKDGRRKTLRAGGWEHLR